ncbi:hypothetical protein IWX49DRAFT_327544 [Phyllosticta citricarpa]|uniref:Uncharacterized protein n=1 Tax=Phyllosticta citricarpa TaxID=55181 RepID=A0ABR1LF88_9PEZI
MRELHARRWKCCHFHHVYVFSLSLSPLQQTPCHAMPSRYITHRLCPNRWAHACVVDTAACLLPSQLLQHLRRRHLIFPRPKTAACIVTDGWCAQTTGSGAKQHSSKPSQSKKARKKERNLRAVMKKEDAVDRRAALTPSRVVGWVDGWVRTDWAEGKKDRYVPMYVCLS